MLVVINQNRTYYMNLYSDFTGRFLKSPKCELCNIAFVNCHRESRLVIMPIDVYVFRSPESLR